MAQKRKMFSNTRRQLRAWQVFGLFCFLLSIGLLVALIVVTSHPDYGDCPSSLDKSVSGTTKSPPKNPTTAPCAGSCATPEAVQPPDEQNPTVFQDLSETELQAVLQYLFNQSNLNLVPVSEARVNSTYIYTIELYVPYKSKVLDHLDRNMTRPVRAARAVLFRGDLTTPVVQEYIVSPLPRPSHHEDIANGTYTRYPIPYDARPMSVPESVALEPIVDQVSRDLHDLLVESFGTGAQNCSDKCILFELTAQVSDKGEGRRSVFVGMRDLPGRYLHPLGIEVMVSHPGADISQWTVEQILYNNWLFGSSAELMTQYRAGNVTKLALNFPDMSGSEFSTFRRRGPDPSPDSRRGPRMYQVDGARYKITGQHVEYMNWDFHFGLRPVHGIQLFDVRFQGERIAYEISPQEMSAFYSGHSLTVISSHFLDISFARTSFEMVKGIDCPLEASYLNSHQLWDDDDVSLRKNVICIFEYDNASPIMRHYASDFDGGYTFYGGVADYVLTLRTIATVFNYDYVVDFCFHTNGVIHVKVAATGYVIGTLDLPQERQGYGFPVHDNVFGSLHQHMYNFKVDLDIAGERNRFTTYDLSLETIPHPWFPNTNKTQTRIDQSVKTTEMDARVFYDFDKPQYYVIYNENATNSVGSKRGYRIINGGMTKLMLPDEGAARHLRWGKYQLAVTKFKELEPASSSMYALNPSVDPVVDFDLFLEDNENIQDEDLIVWLTMGVHHAPTAEDVPTVSIPGMSKSFYLRPFNYFDEDASVSSRDAVLIVPDEDFNPRIETYGRSNDAHCLPRQFGPLEYDGTW